MGWPEYDALWKYESLSEPLLTSELSRLASPVSLHNTHSVTFQPCPNPDETNQDRLAILDWSLPNGTWQFRAVFDGHAGHDTVDYVVQTLPPMIKVALTSLVSGGSDPTPADVSDVLRDVIASLDEDLTRDLLRLFPDPNSFAHLTDDEIRSIINDHHSGGKNAAIISRCMRGTTVLLSLVDPNRLNVWVASLGDCQAVLGLQHSDGHWETSLLGSFHNAKDMAERQRIMMEHPGEVESVIEGRVLGAIAVTKAIGDHLFKLPSIYTERVFMNARPGFEISRKIEDFLGRNLTPPYISNRADVRHAEIGGREGYLMMCTDGLLDLYEVDHRDLDRMAEAWVNLLSKGEKLEGRLNLALYILRDALGGEDTEKVSRMITVEMCHKWMDDTTIIVQKY